MKWVRRANDKPPTLDLQKGKETFQQAKAYFSDPIASRFWTLPCSGVSGVRQQKTLHR